MWAIVINFSGRIRQHRFREHKVPVDSDWQGTWASEDLAEMLIDSEVNWRFERVAIVVEHKEVTFGAEEGEQVDLTLRSDIVCLIVALIRGAVVVGAVDGEAEWDLRKVGEFGGGYGVQVFEVWGFEWEFTETVQSWDRDNL